MCKRKGAMARDGKPAASSSGRKLHGAKVTSQAVGDGVTMSEWILDVEFKGAPHMEMHQAAVRHWEHGKIVKERFYHA